MWQLSEKITYIKLHGIQENQKHQSLVCSGIPVTETLISVSLYVRYG